MSFDSKTTCVWTLAPDVSASLVIETIPDGIIVLDSNCRIRQWNRAMSHLSGHYTEDMLGEACVRLDFRDALSGEALHHESQCLMDRNPDPQQRHEVECFIRHADGSSIPVRKVSRVIVNGKGQAVGILLVLHDLRPLRQLEEQLARIESREGSAVPPGRLVGVSPQMQEVYRRIAMAGSSETTVLITGETGTGKELVAEALHLASPRRNRPLVKVNCSALTETLLESELFGHVKGSFTGAVRDSAGRLEAAEGGTLFLDEIGDLSPLIQLKLLRLLQERQYERVGDAETRTADVRFVAATHRDIKSLVEAGTFREDLYYRIHVYPIEIPPLRERKDDIPELCQAFIRQLNKSTGKVIVGLSEEAGHCLSDYCWPGNVRQLENAIEHAFVSCVPPRIQLEDLPPELRTSGRRARECLKPRFLPSVSQSSGRGNLTRDMLLNALESHGWNQSRAAQSLGVNRTTVWRRMRQWDLREG